MTVSAIAATFEPHLAQRAAVARAQAEARDLEALEALEADERLVGARRDGREGEETVWRWSPCGAPIAGGLVGENVTSAPGTAAPDSSTTVPLSSAVMRCA